MSGIREDSLVPGKFDAIFIADVVAPYTNFAGNSDSALRYAVQCPVHDPTVVVPIIGTATTKLGVGLTLCSDAGDLEGVGLSARAAG